VRILELLDRDTTYAAPEKEKAVNLYVEELSSLRSGDTAEHGVQHSREPEESTNP